MQKENDLLLTNLNKKGSFKTRPKSAVRTKKERICEKLNRVIQDTKIDMEFQ
jgi:hypothetical protein